MNGADVDRSEPARVYSRFVHQALPRYGFGPDTVVELLNLSENGTFRLIAGDRGAIMRVHRAHYHARASVESELAWLTAVRTDTGLRTPTPIPAANGDLVCEVSVEGAVRNVVLFETVPGAEPPIEGLTDRFVDLGRLTAEMHEHVRRWRPPPGFQRFAWDWRHTLGARPRWGRWQDGVEVDRAAEQILSQAADHIEGRLVRFGMGPQRYGLIHADLRTANLMVDGDAVCVIDFDDCGYGWNLYDLGTAVSFLEDHPSVADWCAAWLSGYRTVRPLPPADEQEIDTFIMLRRLLLVAWIGSHRDTDLAIEMGTRYTAGSCDLAERYLSGAALH